jgi:hypothetical protein
VSPLRYELGFYIPEDGILRSHRRENHKSYESDSFAIKAEIQVSRSGIPDRPFWNIPPFSLTVSTKYLCASRDQ